MLHRAHPFFPQFVSLLREAAIHPPVYDLGTNGRFAKEVGLVRSLIDEQSYFAGGYRPDMRVHEPCDFDCDIQRLNGIADATAGSVICLSVLEHVLYPEQAVREIYRILRPGGIAVVSVPFFVSYHGKSGCDINPVYERKMGSVSDSSHQGYGDYWRFTHEGLAQLFGRAGFDQVDVFPVDGRILSRISLMGMYEIVRRIPLALKIISVFDRPKLGRATSMHFVRASKA